MFSDFLAPVFAGSQSPLLHDPSFGPALIGLIIGTAASLIGIGLAMRLWYEHRPDPQVVLARLPRVIPLLSYNKFYFDEIYDRALVQPTKAVARTARRVVEPDVMDSWVQGIGDLLRGFSLDLRTVQTGLIRDYASHLHRLRGGARRRVGVHRAMNHIPWLTLLIVIPAGAAILLQLVPRRYNAAVKAVTILATLAGAVIVALLLIWMPGNKASGGPLPLHFQETHAWLPAINATYHLGIDGISAWLLALNAGVFLLGALAISRKSTDRLRFYCTLVLLTQAATTGVLLSIDLLLFYMFWEGMLVPLYILLSNWGGEKRGPATIKFIVYTVAGSLLMLVAIIYLYIQSPSGSFDLESILAQPINSGSAFVIPIIHLTTFTPKELAFICFALAFAIKIPIVPVAHVAAGSLRGVRRPRC